MAKAAAKSSAKQKSQDNALRLVVDENGHFLYMNTALKKFFNGKSPEKLHINDVVEFEDIDEVFYVHTRLRDTDKSKESDDFSYIRPGSHILRFKNGKKRSARKELQFDWVNIPGNKSYLVAITDMIGELPETSDKLRHLILKLTSVQDNDASTSARPVFADVKARLKQRESALFMEMSSELQSIIEETGQFIRFNKNFARILGYSDDDLLNKNGFPITFNPIFIKCVTDALKDFPMMNISYINNKIIKKNYINIGIAVALDDDNLIVPVLKNSDKLSFMDLVRSSHELIKKARDNKLSPDDLDGGTFTISNVGSFGNVMGTPIILQPQVGILAIGSIRKIPSVVETKNGDKIEIRNKLYLSHAYDHRIIDGAIGGKFAQKIANNIENFDLMSIITV